MLGENVERDAWIYALAAHEYYHGDGLTQIISDEEYDALTSILKMNWSEIPEDLKEIFIQPSYLGQGSNHIKLNDNQLEIARGFYNAKRN